ncbi:MAG: shikimate kinase [Lachnospiraceae bacterium]|nr:shikimate kinase [Lachnospiraceae bacterium]
MKENIILIGYMGSGKTTVGQALADKLSYQFLDTDAYIEEEQNTTISHIFEEYGEEYFRNIETKTIENMEININHNIVSTGGGLPLRECNGAILKKMGFVVFLSVKKETVLKRLEGDTQRPLLQGNHVEQNVEEMLNFRNPIYEYTAHIKVEVDNKTVEEITEEICRNYQIMIKQDEKNEGGVEE